MTSGFIGGAMAFLVGVGFAVAFPLSHREPTHIPANATPYCGYSNYRVPCTDEVIEL